MTHLDIVICTYNRAPSLAAVLGRVETLRPPPSLSWSVLVIDNASTDDTPSVIETCRARGKLALRSVYEPTPGVGHARLRGARESAADWIAYVDDDNLLDAGWLEAMAQAISAHPDAGGFGGKVHLQWETPPPKSFRHFGYCYAEQDLGDEPIEILAMVGSGMVLRRAALIACGWVGGPLIADRVGKSMISGGDVEMPLRVSGAGFVLYYVPGAVLQHVQPAARTRFGYLARMARALGASEPALELLKWEDGYEAWKQVTAREVRDRKRKAWRGFWWSLPRLYEIDAAVVWLAAAYGYATGFKQVQGLSEESRITLMSVPYAP